MTKAQQIIDLLSSGITDRRAIAAEVGCRPNYVNQVAWKLRNPTYHADWMREYRESNPRAYRRELDRQKKYKARKWKEAHMAFRYKKAA
jgi:hypothetical protein